MSSRTLRPLPHRQSQTHTHITDKIPPLSTIFLHPTPLAAPAGPPSAMAAGHTTPSSTDASDASDSSLVQPSTPKQAGRKRPRVATPPSPSIGPLGTGTPETGLGAMPAEATAQGQRQKRSQLGTTIEASFEARAKKLTEEGKAAAELGDILSQEFEKWEKAGLTGLVQLTRDINDLVNNYCSDLPAGTNGKTAIKTTPKSWASVAASAAATSAAPMGVRAQGPKQPGSEKQRPTQTARLFVRLPQEHKARTASPYATLQKLRAELPAHVSSHIKGVQAIPSGLAIIPKDGTGSSALSTAKELFSKALEGAETEQEQAWAVYVIPNAPRSYQDYMGDTQQITERQAADEFKLQTGVEPLKLHWASIRGLPGAETGTLVAAVAQDAASRVPRWISLFGSRLPVVRKSKKPRIQQCARCWDYHNEKTCTRRSRCRLCGSKEHTETGHTHRGPSSPDCACPSRCTNCRGPHPADDPGCPIRPYYDGDVIQRKMQSQKEGIRKAQSAAFYTKYTASSCRKAGESSGSGASSQASEDLIMSTLDTQ
jgi:hypothetical protein